MPRFFFDVVDEEGRYSDGTGVDFESLDAVRREAAIALPDMLKDLTPLDRSRNVIVEIYDLAHRKQSVARLTLAFVPDTAPRRARDD